MPRLLTDLRPLKESPDFRRLWMGSTVSQLGQQMTAVTVSIQVYALTGSTFAVGLVGLFALVPLIVFGLYGGAMADAIDRRTLALVSSGGLWLLSMVLVVQSVLEWEQVWVLYAVVAVQSACFAVNNPARSAIIPRLVRPELLPAANTLSQAAFNLGFTAGPLLGATVIAWHGFGAAYLVDVVTFTAALYALFRLPPVPPTGEVRRAGIRSVLEGFTFLRAAPALLATFLADILAMVFAQPRALFPAVAGSFFAGGVKTVGLLQAAPAIGALLGVVFSGWVSRVRRQGIAIVVAITAYAAAVGLFGFARSIWLGVALLAMSGMADMVSSAYRNTVLQSAAPDAMRGRLQGVFIVVVAGGPRLGDFVAGTTADLTTPTIALAGGACVCIVGLLILLARNRPFREYDAEVRALR
ncbi:MFS transporter [Kribbella italica]|uniref:MFS family permease n=1 Tax=Kribbella italica TaxID=1540520 RepID=A0A7W9JFR5_9ACTN|nr:MFS family permease [Kribbella italica]